MHVQKEVSGGYDLCVCVVVVVSLPHFIAWIEFHHGSLSSMFDSAAVCDTLTIVPRCLWNIFLLYACHEKLQTVKVLCHLSYYCFSAVMYISPTVCLILSSSPETVVESIMYSGCLFFRPSIRFSGQILLPRYLMNGLSSVDKTRNIH